MKTKNLILALVIGLCISTFPVLAEEVPPLPHAFYGTVEDVYGNNVPVGAVIQAFVNGIERGSITVTEAGKYGSEEPGGQNLLVQNDIDEGSEITFYIKGVLAKETATFESGEVTQLNLTASEAFPTEAATKKSGGGGFTLPTPTETETAEAGDEGIAEPDGEGIIPEPTATVEEAPSEEKPGFLGFNLFTGLLVAIISAILFAVYYWQKNK